MYIPQPSNAYYMIDDPEYWECNRGHNHPPFSIPSIRDFCNYTDEVCIDYDRVCATCEKFRTWQRRTELAKNGAYVLLKHYNIDGTRIVDSCSLNPTIKDKVDLNNDILMNIKQDDKQKNKFKVKLMTNGISEIVADKGIDIEVTREIVKEVPVEVTKEVEVIVDMTDEVQKEQLNVLKNIVNQLSALQNEVKDAKYDDVLQSILQQLSAVIANNHAVRVING